jgi:hypothetical protein
VKFSAVVNQASALLHSKSRITYHALKREFDLDSASRSAATYATAIVSLWTSRPMKSVLACATADLLYNNDSQSIMRLWPRKG